MKALLITLGAMIALNASIATAQISRCAPREIVVARLAEKFGETRRSAGLSGQSMFETFASDENGTWTIIETYVNGLSCIRASGQAFEQLAEALPPSGTDM